MAMSPIGISFLPSEENQLMGQHRAGLESDLGQAFKILSLRLPTVQGARALSPLSAVPGGNAVGGGGTPAMPGTNPMAAVIEALLRATGGNLPPAGLASIGDRFRDPSVIPGDLTGGGQVAPIGGGMGDNRATLGMKGPSTTPEQQSAIDRKRSMFGGSTGGWSGY